MPAATKLSHHLGERVDALDRDDIWSPATIVKIRDDASEVLISYDGWGDEWDEWVKVEAKRLAPVHMFSKLSLCWVRIDKRPVWPATVLLRRPLQGSQQGKAALSDEGKVFVKPFHAPVKYLDHGLWIDVERVSSFARRNYDNQQRRLPKFLPAIEAAQQSGVPALALVFEKGTLTKDNLAPLPASASAVTAALPVLILPAAPAPPAKPAAPAASGVIELMDDDDEEGTPRYRRRAASGGGGGASSAQGTPVRYTMRGKRGASGGGGGSGASDAKRAKVVDEDKRSDPSETELEPEDEAKAGPITKEAVEQAAAKAAAAELGGDDSEAESLDPADYSQRARKKNAQKHHLLGKDDEEVGSGERVAAPGLRAGKFRRGRWTPRNVEHALPAVPFPEAPKAAKGVSLTRQGHFLVTFSYEGVKVKKGPFKSKAEAAVRYDLSCLELWGNKAASRLNHPLSTYEHNKATGNWQLLGSDAALAAAKAKLEAAAAATAAAANAGASSDGDKGTGLSALLVQAGQAVRRLQHVHNWSIMQWFRGQGPLPVDQAEGAPAGRQRRKQAAPRRLPAAAASSN